MEKLSERTAQIRKFRKLLKGASPKKLDAVHRIMLAVEADAIDKALQIGAGFLGVSVEEYKARVGKVDGGR